MLYSSIIPSYECIYVVIILIICAVIALYMVCCDNIKSKYCAIEFSWMCKLFLRPGLLLMYGRSPAPYSPLYVKEGKTGKKVK